MDAFEIDFGDLPINEKSGVEHYDSTDSFALIQIAELSGNGEVHEGADVGNHEQKARYVSRIRWVFRLDSISLIVFIRFNFIWIFRSLSNMITCFN